MGQAKEFEYDAKYYDRTVEAPNPSKSFENNRSECLRILKGVIESFDNRLNLNNPESISTAIHTRKKERERIGESEHAKQLDNEINVLENYNKIKSAQLVSIPIPGRDEPALYYAIQDHIGGVTAKVSLSDKNSVDTILNELVKFNFETLRKNKHPPNLQDYITVQDKCTVKTNAILKLPKHGNIQEVLREDLALSISRNLGFNTTDSAMVNYKGEPALFVPFKDIKLMKEFSRGVTFHEGKKTYSHYSTLTPVGEGSMPNQFIKSFGNTLGYMQLCNDPDALGGYNKNKALTNEKDFFIFDQVLFGKNLLGVDNFIVDSRCNMVPNPDSILRHSRHYRGRNRTLVDDNPLAEKLESMFDLIDQKENILQMVRKKVIDPYLEKVNTNQDQDGTIEKLAKAGMATYDTIERRIDHMFDHLPKYNGRNLGEVYKTTSTEDEKNAIKQDMVHILALEKLMNHPRLYAKDGRPYSNPWTDRHTNTIKNIEAVVKDGKTMYKIHFSKTPDKALLKGISRQLGDKEGNLYIGMAIEDNREILMSQKDLRKIQETSFFPGSNPQFNKLENYLDVKRLEMLMNNYGMGYRHQTMEVIKTYNKAKETHGNDEKAIVPFMKDTLSAIKDLKEKAIERDFDQGFVNHALRCLNFEIQKFLQKTLKYDETPPELMALVEKAFDTAVKLDRVESFNKALMEEVLKKPEERFDDNFKAFLKNFQELDGQMGHTEAVKKSASMFEACENVHKQPEKQVNEEVELKGGGMGGPGNR